MDLVGAGTTRGTALGTARMAGAGPALAAGTAGWLLAHVVNLWFVAHSHDGVSTSTGHVHGYAAASSAVTGMLAVAALLAMCWMMRRTRRREPAAAGLARPVVLSTSAFLAVDAVEHAVLGWERTPVVLLAAGAVLHALCTAASTMVWLRLSGALVLLLGWMRPPAAPSPRRFVGAARHPSARRRLLWAEAIVGRAAAARLAISPYRFAGPIYPASRACTPHITRNSAFTRPRPEAGRGAAMSQHIDTGIRHVLWRRVRTFRTSVHQAHRDGGWTAGIREAGAIIAEVALRPVRQRLEHRRDARNRLDTSADTGLWTRPVDSRSGGAFDDGVAYSPVPLHRLRNLLRRLPIDSPADYAFIDLGCGKGRTLFVAAEAGFAPVIGVELDPRLAGIARANVSA